MDSDMGDSERQSNQINSLTKCFGAKAAMFLLHGGQ